ncbi:MAG TPA: hypothetical protein VF427_04695 [Noviherbaspirillum sp.]
MAAHAVVVHRIPGRVRLRIQDRRGNAAYFSNLSENLARFENVHNARANPVTGSIALEFAGSLDEVLRRAEKDDLLTIVEAVATDKNPFTAGANAFSDAAPPVNLVSGHDMNRMFMVGLMLLAVSLIQAFRGQWFPPALSVFWYAWEAFSLSNLTEGRGGV